MSFEDFGKRTPARCVDPPSETQRVKGRWVDRVTRTEQSPLPSHQIKMAELGELRVDRTRIKPPVPNDLLRGTPKFHANYVLTVVTNYEVALTFCIRESTINVIEENDTALPQATVLMSMAEAEALSASISRSIARVRDAMAKEAEGANG